ncbi:DNA replication complex GINS protein PSF1-like isoform X1 [Daktulosphaira vitifoliae]|uniref:DNA replication complex GINS protein PSF1-like isoform X1 n=1 Tax=Daktulosphaira vitifoliae TaxID=58002 RepID=UPI0021AA5BC4|nr:DNA replication complex GINS protein PSF1-like isoform X1 [Daktulosphaira vitifoliae]
MYCDRVIELLKELERSREDTIPPYNNDGVNQVLTEMKILDDEILDIIRNHPRDQVPMDPVLLRRAAIERNKRCLMTYIWTRLQRLKEMRWEIGAILPIDIRQNLSQSEIEWFNSYCKSLVLYMKSIGPDTGLNLFQDMKPPKSLYTEVRSLVDAGKLELESGEILILRKNSQYMLSRSQAEPLIRQGILEQVRY